MINKNLFLLTASQIFAFTANIIVVRTSCFHNSPTTFFPYFSHDANCGAWLGRPIFAPGFIIDDPATIAEMAPNWSPTHLFERIIPRLRELGVSDAAITTMTDENPARWFEGTEAPSGPS